MLILGRLGQRVTATEVVNLARLKWAGIVIPIAALFVLVILLRSSLHDWLHESPGVLFLGGLFAVCVFAFASVMFALIEDLEARVLDQNRTLSNLVARTDRQNAELSAFLTVGRAAASSVELSNMLDEALKVLAVTPAEAAIRSRMSCSHSSAFRSGAAAFGSSTCSWARATGGSGCAQRSSFTTPVSIRALRATRSLHSGWRPSARFHLHRADGRVLAVAAGENRVRSEELRVLGDRRASSRSRESASPRAGSRRAVLETRAHLEAPRRFAQVLGYINTQTQA
jgi:hypothetical protein